MTSVEQIVKHIIEDLSDGVSELVLTIIVLAEQNQPITQRLPATAEGVNQTASKLAKIAHQLASTDYGQYPTIAKEIDAAASAVEEATKTLSLSIESLKVSADKKKGWETLTESCRVMSGNTIRLLQIVYGAPLQRIVINAERLEEDIKKFPPRGRDPLVAEKLKPVTDNALRMEKYLKDRANASESPNESKQLRRAADDVRNKAQGLVDAINHGYKNPNEDDLTVPLRDLNDIVVRGKNLARNTGAPSPTGPLGRGPQLSQGYQRKPNPEQKKAVDDAVRKLMIPMGNNHIFMSPEDENAKYLQMLRDALNNLRRDVDNKNRPGANQHIQQVVRTANDLAKRYNTPDPDIPDWANQRRQQAAEDLERGVHPLVEKAKAALQDLHDDGAVDDLLDTLDVLERAGARGMPRSVPGTATTGNRFGDPDWRQIKDNVDRAINAARRGDPKEFQNAADAAQRGMDQFRRFNIKKGSFMPDPSKLDGPSEELLNLWKKFQANRGKPEELEKIGRQMDDSWNRYNNATAAGPIDASYALDDALDDVVGAVEARDPNRLALAEKNVHDRLRQFNDSVANSNDPRVRAAGQRAATQLGDSVPNYLQKAREGLKKTDRFANNRPALGKTLAEFREEASPQDDCLINENHGAAIQLAQANLRNALASGDKAKIQAALDALRSALAAYDSAIRPLATKQADPGKREYLTHQARAIGDLQEDLLHIDPAGDPRTIRRMVAPIEPLVSEFSDSLRADRGDDFVKGSAKAANIAAVLRMPNNEDMDLGGLLKTAGDMADLLRGMAQNNTQNTQNTQNLTDRFGKDSAGPLAETGKYALEVKNMTKGMGGGGEFLGQEASTYPVTSSFMDDVQYQGNEMSDVMMAVSKDVREKGIVARSAAADSVAKELSNLSTAARTGKKEQMLLASKAAAVHLAALSKELLDYANKMPCRNAREREAQNTLIRSANGLKNYATHLKILTAVKAASIHETKDTDQSLTTLATELGNIISVGMETLSKAQGFKV